MKWLSISIILVSACGYNPKDSTTKTQQNNRLYKSNIVTASCPVDNPCFCKAGSYGVCMTKKDCADVGGTCS